MAKFRAPELTPENEEVNEHLISLGLRAPTGGAIQMGAAEMLDGFLESIWARGLREFDAGNRQVIGDVMRSYLQQAEHRLKPTNDEIEGIVQILAGRRIRDGRGRPSAQNKRSAARGFLQLRASKVALEKLSLEGLPKEKIRIAFDEKVEEIADRFGVKASSIEKWAQPSSGVLGPRNK